MILKYFFTTENIFKGKPMETIVERITKLNKELETKLESNKEYTKMKEFYDDVKSKGLVMAESYNLPPIDTIGKRYFKEKINLQNKY